MKITTDGKHLNTPNIKSIPLSEVDLSPTPVRATSDKQVNKVAASIKQHGQLMPVFVFKHQNRYCCFDGVARIKAMRKLKLPTVVVRVFARPAY